MDHYRTLQVTRDADPEVIDRAYRALSRKYHPDRVDASQRPQATTRMQSINDAYSVLRDPAKRAAYDKTLPPEQRPSGWDTFMEHGLIGLFKERYRSRRG